MRLTRDGHTVTTTDPTEIVQLKALGYIEVPVETESETLVDVLETTPRKINPTKENRNA